MVFRCKLLRNSASELPAPSTDASLEDSVLVLASQVRPAIFRVPAPGRANAVAAQLAAGRGLGAARSGPS